MKKAYRCMAVLFAVGIIVCTVLWLLLPTRTYSARERRMLAQAPAFSWDALLSGAFMSDFESFVSDQFPARDAWTGIKGISEQALGKQENNGIYYGAQGYLLNGLYGEGSKLEDNLRYLNTFAERFEGRIALAAIPNSAGVYPELLPAYAPALDQAKTLAEIREAVEGHMAAPDLLAALGAHKQEAVYFKTDHHYTMRGAYYTYVQIMAALGQEPLPLDAFTVSTLSKEFYGTYYAKAGTPLTAPDVLELYQPIDGYSYTMTVHDTGETREGLYNFDYLQTEDQYALFLDGNRASITVHTSVKNGRTLLVLKDSYAHCLVPFLANHYERLEIVDLRYFKQNIAAYAREKGCNEAVFVYGIESLLRESGLGVLGFGA